MFDVEFNDPRVVSLFNNEIVGQLSDGIYENWNAGNKRWWATATVGNENKMNYYLGHFNYNIDRIRRELFKYELDERMFVYIAIADKYCQILVQDKMLAHQFVIGAEKVAFSVCGENNAVEKAKSLLSDEYAKTFLDQYQSIEQALDDLELETLEDDKCRRRVVREVFKLMKAAIADAEANFRFV